MHIATSIKQKACEGLLHFRSYYSIAKELGISKGSVRDWSILINHGNFDWIYQTYRPQNKTLLHEAINFWFDNYPIGYSDVARRFGIRPASLFGAILRHLDKLPDMLKPENL